MTVTAKAVAMVATPLMTALFTGAFMDMRAQNAAAEHNFAPDIQAQSGSGASADSQEAIRRRGPKERDKIMVGRTASGPPVDTAPVEVGRGGPRGGGRDKIMVGRTAPSGAPVVTPDTATPAPAQPSPPPPAPK